MSSFISSKNRPSYNRGKENHARQNDGTSRLREEATLAHMNYSHTNTHFRRFLPRLSASGRILCCSEETNRYVVSIFSVASFPFTTLLHVTNCTHISDTSAFAVKATTSKHLWIWIAYKDFELWNFEPRVVLLFMVFNWTDIQCARYVCSIRWYCISKGLGTRRNRGVFEKIHNST